MRNDKNHVKSRRLELRVLERYELEQIVGAAPPNPTGLITAVLEKTTNLTKGPQREPKPTPTIPYSYA